MGSFKPLLPQRFIMVSQMIHIAIADHHELMREGLKVLFERTAGMRIVGEAATAFSTLAHTKENSMVVDVLILDPEMPGRSGLEIITQIKNILPIVSVLVLTSRREPGFACRALRAGASGYLTKSGPFAEVLTAVRLLASGRPYISAGVAEQLAMELSLPQGRNPHETFTHREQQIFDLLLRGDSLTKIAGDLHLSVKTISTHKARIMGKLNLSSFSEMMQYAMAHGFISTPDFNQRDSIL